MTRHWTINGRFLTQPVTGVQRYAREITSALDRLLTERHPWARDLSIDIVCPPGAKHDLPLRRITVRATSRGSGYYWEQFELPAAARCGLLSFCNVGPIIANRHVLCIHDVNTFLAPASYSWKFRTLYRWLLPTLGRAASRVVTVSNFSASQIARLGIALPSKVTVIPNGREHASRWISRHSPSTRAVACDRTIVVIGSPAPHKNVAMLLGLSKDLAAAGLKLAVVGSLGAKVFASCQVGEVERSVFWLGRVTDAEIAALLQDCLCLAVPSLTEGFGLPALEAMALGCPVVVSDRASLPEICADAALYGPPDEPHRWLAHFLALKEDRELRIEMRRRGIAAAQRYSWSQSAERYLQVLAEVDGVPLSSGKVARADREPAAPESTPSEGNQCSSADKKW
jgi:glycosyltransferase involved in cell wall biosynthesis